MTMSRRRIGDARMSGISHRSRVARLAVAADRVAVVGRVPLGALGLAAAVPSGILILRDIVNGGSKQAWNNLVALE